MPQTTPIEIPDDYEKMSVLIDGTVLTFWGRIVETELPDGTKKLTIKGMIPEE